MVHKLVISGPQSSEYVHIRESVSAYLTAKALSFEIVEGEINHSLDNTLVPTIIQYRDSILTMETSSELSSLLSELHHLIDERENGKGKRCLNCANCRCMKDS